jgi:hypothetical protein
MTGQLRCACARGGQALRQPQAGMWAAAPGPEAAEGPGRRMGPGPVQVLGWLVFVVVVGRYRPAPAAEARHWFASEGSQMPWRVHAYTICENVCHDGAQTCSSFASVSALAGRWFMDEVCGACWPPWASDSATSDEVAAFTGSNETRSGRLVLCLCCVCVGAVEHQPRLMTA